MAAALISFDARSALCDPAGAPAGTFEMLYVPATRSEWNDTPRIMTAALTGQSQSEVIPWVDMSAI